MEHLQNNCVKLLKCANHTMTVCTCTYA